MLYERSIAGAGGVNLQFGFREKDMVFNTFEVLTQCSLASLISREESRA